MSIGHINATRIMSEEELEKSFRESGKEREILKKAEVSIKDDFDRFSELPKELRVTILNIYYRAIHKQKYNDHHRLFQDMKKSIGNSDRKIGDYLEFIKVYDFSKSEVQYIKTSVNNLFSGMVCSMDDFKEQVQILLDVHKWHIDGAAKKSKMRRNIERKLKKDFEVSFLDIHCMLTK